MIIFLKKWTEYRVVDMHCFCPCDQTRWEIIAFPNKSKSRNIDVSESEYYAFGLVIQENFLALVKQNLCLQ